MRCLKKAQNPGRSTSSYRSISAELENYIKSLYNEIQNIQKEIGAVFKDFVQWPVSQTLSRVGVPLPEGLAFFRSVRGSAKQQSSRVVVPASAADQWLMPLVSPSRLPMPQ